MATPSGPRRLPRAWVALGVLGLAIACMTPFTEQILLSTCYEMLHDKHHPEGIHVARKTVNFAPGAPFILYECPDCPAGGDHSGSEIDFRSAAVGVGRNTYLEGRVLGVHGDTIVLTVGSDDGVEAESLFLMKREDTIIGLCKIGTVRAGLSQAEVVFLVDGLTPRMKDDITGLFPWSE